MKGRSEDELELFRLSTENKSFWYLQSSCLPRVNLVPKLGATKKKYPFFL